jgi:predicted ATPase
VSQSADRQFAARALDKARATLREPDLRRRYAEIAALHHELHTNGLTEQTIEVAFPEGRTNPTERRILNLFLDDWEEKLAPLQPVHEKLQILREVVDLKIASKNMRFTEEGQVVFESPIAQEVAVDHLSSGEQHMLALFTMLLFTAKRGALVLIDEPEISLHAAWKHEFLSDIEKVSRLIPVSVVMATHSSALINSRWELVEELALGE